jgi:hypothetical protein
MALTKDGKLFGWGYSENGRLGEIGQSTRAPSAEEYIGKMVDVDKYSSSMMEAVEKMVEEKIRSEDNMPIIWEPSLVHEASPLEVSDVSCGLDHSLILFCEYFFLLQIKSLLCTFVVFNAFHVLLCWFLVVCHPFCINYICCDVVMRPTLEIACPVDANCACQIIIVIQVSLSCFDDSCLVVLYSSLCGQFNI